MLHDDLSLPLRVLLVDDDVGDAEILELTFRQVPGWSVDLSVVCSADEALVAIEQEDAYDLLLLEQRCARSTPEGGLDELERLRQAQGLTPIVFLSSSFDPEVAVSALRGGALDYLPKNHLSASSIERTVRNALDKSRLARELHERQQELEAANTDLCRRQREIEGFYHTLSHELKTPLTAAHEFTAILLEGITGELSTDQRRYLEIVLDSCDQMRVFLDDILDATRLETGKLAIRPQPGDLRALVERSVETAALMASEGGVQLEAQVPDGLSRALIDGKRIAQVMNNLLSNAIKFTDAGGHVLVSAEEQEEHLHVSVRDTGRGIPQAEHGRIFDRLYQVEEGNHRSSGGLGLGLHICRQLVELHGGEITLTSTVGEGSCFTFTLPLASTPERV